MNILIIAATQKELSIIREGLMESDIHHTISYLITDVGMMASCFHLTRQLTTHTYDLVIQAGIGGAMDSKLAIGDVVEVVADTYGDVGAEDQQAFIPAFNMGLMQQDSALFNSADHFIYNTKTYTGLPHVKGITVNTCTGSTDTNERRSTLFGAAVESMEGLAVHYVCSQLEQAFLQVRAISNYTGIRNTAEWDMPLALKNLNTFMVTFLKQENPTD